MDIISPEMDSLTPKTPDYMYHTPCFMKRYILRICRTSFGGHLEISLIKIFAQGCQSGNQARIVLEWPLNKNHQKKFIGKNISRSAIGCIGPSNRLYIRPNNEMTYCNVLSNRIIFIRKSDRFDSFQELCMQL